MHGYDLFERILEVLYLCTCMYRFLEWFMVSMGRSVFNHDLTMSGCPDIVCCGNVAMEGARTRSSSHKQRGTMTVVNLV